MKTVSAIVTTYNSEESILRTLGSIKAQTGLNRDFKIELIVVDDCSNDNTVEIAMGAGAKVLSTPRNSGGPNAGRNIGLNACAGDYICIVDHDDEWKPDRIQRLLGHLEDAPIVSSGYTRIDTTNGNNTDFVKVSQETFTAYNKNETFLSKLNRSKTGQGIYLGSLIYSSNLKNILFEEHFGCVDYDWLLRLFKNQHSIEVNDSLYYRHVEGENLSLNRLYRQMDYEYSLRFIESLEAEYPMEVAISRKRINGTRARYHYVMNEMIEARTYFKQSEFNLKTLAYYLTTFAGHNWVNKKFNVFK